MIHVSQLDAMLFDLDETLFSRAAAARSWAAAFAAAEGLGAGFVPEYLDLDGNGYAPRGPLLDWVDAQTGHRYGVDALLTRYRAELPGHCVLPPEASALLAELDKRAIKVAIITNGPPSQWGKLRAMGLAARPALVSEEFGAHKPDPAIFRAALERLGVSATRSAFVGDNPRTDILGAHAAGMGSIWLRHGSVWPEAVARPSWTVDSLAEVLAALTAGAARAGS